MPGRGPHRANFRISLSPVPTRPGPACFLPSPVHTLDSLPSTANGPHQTLHPPACSTRRSKSKTTAGIILGRGFGAGNWRSDSRPDRLNCAAVPMSSSLTTAPPSCPAFPPHFGPFPFLHYRPGGSRKGQLGELEDLASEPQPFQGPTS